MVIIMNKAKKKVNKLLLILLISTIISFILGCLFISIVDNNGRSLIKESINSYFDGIFDGKTNYINGLYTILPRNIFTNIIIWLVGISIIGIIIVSCLLLFKSFLVGFSLSSIIYTYGFKGILISIIYMISEVINLFIIFLLTYYSISFSILLFNYLFRKKEYNRRIIMKRYIKIFIICLGITILNSLISIFLIPNLLRFF